jgi:hypothetical protein
VLPSSFSANPITLSNDTLSLVDGDDVADVLL